MRKSLWAIMSVLVVLGLLSACAQPTPQVIEKPVTVVVEKQVPVEKQVVSTVVVEKQVTVEKVVKETVVVEKQVTVEKVVKQTVVVEAEPKQVNVDAMVAKMQIQEKDWAPVRGGTFRIMTDQEPPTLDPHTATTLWCTTVSQNIFDQLVAEGSDGEFYPWLATSWMASSDGKTYTFKLRKDVKFQDGTPFNAQAVKFNIDRLIDPKTKTGMSSGMIKTIESAKVIDDFTVAISLKEPDAVFLLNISDASLGMVSPAAVQKWGEDFGRHPVGTGAYKFKEWQQSLFITLVRNEDYYWPPPFYRNRGPAYPSEITIKWIKEKATRLAAMLAGETDWYSRLPPPDDYKTVEKDGRFRVFKVLLPGATGMLTMNTKLPPTNDIKVRQAIEYGLDRNQWVAAGGGFWPPSYGPLSPSTFGYNPDVEKMYPYDPKKAAALLDEAGWTMGSDGYRSKGGVRLKVTCVGGGADWFVLDQAELKKLGIEAELVTLEVGAWLSAMHTGEKYHMSGMAWGYPDPSVLQNMYHSSNIGKASFQWSVYNNPKVDQLLEKGRTELDRAKRAEYYKEVQKILMEDAVTFPTTVSGLCYGLGPRVRGNIWVSGKQMEYLQDVYLTK